MAPWLVTVVQAYPYLGTSKIKAAISFPDKFVTYVMFFNKTTAHNYMRISLHVH